MEIVKKAIATIAIILMILTSSMTIAVTKQAGKVTTDTLRLRKEASLESTVLELIYKNEEVEIVGEEGDWYKVKFKTYTGYVSKEYISKNEEVDTNTNTNQNNSNNNVNENNEDNNQEENNTSNEQNANENNSKNDKLANKKATLNSDLDVYILPLINSNIIGKLKQNTKVEIVSITGVWTYIKTEELAGWIRLDKISIVYDNGEASNTNSNNTTTNEQNTNNNTTTEKNTNNNQNQTNNNNQTNTNTETTFTPKTYYIKSSAVNVREKSTTSSSVVTTLSQNTQVKVVGEQSDWYKVEINGKNGYILKSLLSEKKIEVTTRSAVQERNDATSTENKKSSNTASTKKEDEATSYNASKGEEVIAYAKKYLGCKYVYGGSGPKTFDCSGFTMYVYKKFGFSLPHSATSQSRLGKYVSKSNLQPGDLVIFNNRANTSIGHVGIYVGGGNFIHASSGGGKIMISSLSGSYYKTRYVTGRRLV